MQRQLRFPYVAATLGFIFVIPLAYSQSAALEQRLRDQYQGKTLMLRGFYSADHLRYNSAGVLTSFAPSGDWTADGFVVVNEIRLSRQRLTIKAKRLLVVSIDKKFQFQVAEQPERRRKEKKPVLLEIEADIGTDNSSADRADAALAGIFLTAQDHLVDLIPDYWNPCVRAGLIAKDLNCHFSPEMLAIPGVHRDEDSSASDTPGASENRTKPGVDHVGGGVSPPRLTFQKDPEFSERARQAKYQGIVVLNLVVNEEGLPTNIHILNPLGCGLDAKAVQAVETWRFQPAEKDGQPVPVEIAVEVDFHLY